MSWVRSFQLVAIEDARVLIAVRPGHRDLAKFVTEAKRAQLAALVETLTGKRVKIDIVKADETPGNDDPPPQTTTQQHRVTADQRRAALNLPLVKAVSDLFETQLIDVRREYNDTDAEPADDDTN